MNQAVHSRQFAHRVSLYCLLVASVIAAPRLGFAQLPTLPSSPPSTSSSVDGQAKATQVQDRIRSAQLALDGFCPVTIIDERLWEKGKPEFAVLLDGMKYMLASREHQQKFIKNTNQYAPMLSTHCVMHYVNESAFVPGTLSATAIHKDRLYLFASLDEKHQFMKTPERFENADLAYGGLCSVSLVEGNKEVQGDKAFGTIYGGKRYYFASMNEKRRFLAEPSKFLEGSRQTLKPQADND